MNPEQLSHLRHTLAHLLAQAVLEEYPNAQLTHSTRYKVWLQDSPKIILVQLLFLLYAY
jgi:formate hydrogenlyase subunit 6/NADH:ubiquinone oxidoreductase subunit I